MRYILRSAHPMIKHTPACLVGDPAVLVVATERAEEYNNDEHTTACMLPTQQRQQGHRLQHETTACSSMEGSSSKAYLHFPKRAK